MEKIVDKLVNYSLTTREKAPFKFTSEGKMAEEVSPRKKVTPSGEPLQRNRVNIEKIYIVFKAEYGGMY